MYSTMCVWPVTAAANSGVMPEGYGRNRNSDFTHVQGTAGRGHPMSSLRST